MSPEHNRVLVVDDERSVRELLADSLDMMGYRVETASDAGDAFQRLQAGSYELVLSDIDMPGESGLDLLKKVKDHDPDIEMVMVTGVVDTETAVHSIREGASDYITKPFNLEEVRIVIDRTLEKQRLIRENREYQLRLEEKVAERTRELVEKNEEVSRLYSDLEEAYESTLTALVTALDFRDNETQGHSTRVVEYAVLVARQLGIEEHELDWIRRGSLLHDVGKIGISDAVLRKPGKLDDAEWAEMKKHPEMGYRMLEPIRFLEPALDIVLSHQERWDGTGYPQGLAGKQIPLGARIFAVVDTFDAMTSDRPYRKALPIDRAIQEVRDFAGTQFDPEVARRFLEISPEMWREIRERVHRQVSGDAGAARGQWNAGA